MRSHAVAGCLLLIVSACGGTNYEARLVTDRPEAADLEGVYVLGEQTMVDPRGFAPPTPPELRLLPGGRFEVRGFPSWQIEGRRWTLARFLDATGVWRVIPHRGIEGKTAWGITLTAPIARMAALARHDERRQLIFTYGDVNRGDVMVFDER